MTAIATSITRPPRRIARPVLRRAADAARRVVANVAYAWASFVEAGQLGPSEHSQISRHTGARI